MSNSRKSMNAEPPSNTILVSDASIVELMSEHVPNMLMYIKSKGMEEYAEDIIGNAFLAILEQSKKQHITDPRSYLFITVRNEVTSHYKSKQRDREFDMTSYKTVCNQSLIDDHEFVKELRLEDERRMDRIKNLMESYLSEEARLIMTLKMFENKSYKDISSFISKPEPTIRKSLSRSIQTIKNLV